MSLWKHKVNPLLTLQIKEVHPTILVGEVWNPYDPNKDSQCETINVSYQGLFQMWEPNNGNLNSKTISAEIS